MFMDSPDILIYVAGGGFLLGWFVGKIGAYFGNKIKARSPDPRDNKIRSMSAELRIAQTDFEKSKAALEEQGKTLQEERDTLAQRDQLISEQVETIARLKSDLKESVIKTRELRAELTDRAAENVKSEVRLRDVETELSIAHASTDMISTGVLDYTVAPETETED
jgi:chromosome segregation ATPase